MEFKVAVILFSFIAFSCVGLNSARIVQDEFDSEIDSLEFTDKASVDCGEFSANLTSLIATAEINYRCWKVANSAFKEKFANRTFVIQIAAADRPEDGADGIVYVDGFEKAQKTLKYFGVSIGKLHLEVVYKKTCNSIEFNQTSEILSAISVNCANSLNELSLNFENCGLDVFQDLTGTFHHVHSFSIAFNQELLTANIALNQVFPHVKRMHLHNLKQVSSTRFVAFEFPHMEEFTVAKWLLEKSASMSFTIFIGKNRQIKTFGAVDPSAEVLQYVNYHLQNLQTLEIHNFNDDLNHNELVRFKTVRAFASYDCTKPPTNFTFDVLREMTYGGAHCNVLDDTVREFIFKYQNISKLSLGHKVSNADVSKIAEKCGNLTEAHLTVDRFVSPDTVAAFFNKTKTLNKLRLHHVHLLNPFLFESTLQEKLPKSCCFEFNTTLTETHLTIEKFHKHHNSSNSSDGSGASTMIAFNSIVLFVVSYFVQNLRF